MARVMVTGASGFLGSRVVVGLREKGHDIVALARNVPSPPATAEPEVEWISADICDTSRCADALEGVEVVIHAAAVTGKARRHDYRRVNTQATGELVQACVERGVQRFVFVSSIAAGFNDRTAYPYADSKLAAEDLVLCAGLDCMTVRPTMIFGEGSPIQESMTKLARLPLIPVFGSGRVSVQPVAVDDVAEFLATAVDYQEPLNAKVVGLGGPDTLDLIELLQRIRLASGGQRARVLRLPLGLTRTALRILEPAFLRLLPLTAGQLATFANPSVVEQDPLVEEFIERRRGLKELLGATSVR